MKIDSHYIQKNLKAVTSGLKRLRVAQMLKVINANSVDELIDQTIPANIRLKTTLNLPAAKSEYRILARFQEDSITKQEYISHSSEWVITIPLRLASS